MLGTRCVLVVDDNVRVLQSLERALRWRGVASLAIASFDESVCAIQQMREPPLACLVDIHLGAGKSGIDLVHLLGQRFGEVSFSRALMTGYVLDDGLRRELANLVNGEVLYKPLGGDEIGRFLGVAAAMRSLSVFSPLRSAVADFVTSHHLSVAEARIVGAVVAGVRRSELSAEIGASWNTIKSQVRGLIRKVGATNVEDVVACLLRRVNHDQPDAPPSRGK